MPVLAAFLADRGDQLLDVSVDAIVRAGGTRAIARALADTGERVELLGAAEAAEGVARLVAAEGLAERSQELADEGAELSYEGFEEMAIGESVRRAAVEVGDRVGRSRPGHGGDRLGRRRSPTWPTGRRRTDRVPRGEARAEARLQGGASIASRRAVDDAVGWLPPPGTESQIVRSTPRQAEA